MQADTFSSPSHSDSTLLRLHVHVPASELSWEQQGDSLRAQVRLSWELHALGERYIAVDEKLSLSRHRDAGQEQSFFYARERVLPAGNYRLELICRDEGKKIGGLGGLFGHHPEARLSERIQVRDFSKGGTLADPLIYSFVGEDCPSLPNPLGVYRLGEPWLELRSEFVPPRELTDGLQHYFSLVLSIMDGEGTLRFERKGGWKYGEQNLPLHFRLPLAGLGSGQYRLDLLLQGEGFEATRISRPFFILGDGEVDDSELAQRAIEAQLLLTSKAYESWLTLASAERIESMRRFWKRWDSNPSTGENEVYDEFLRRFEIAQIRYSVFQPGALSDRGRILIRYGEPDEIQVEVMPENRQALINAVRDLHGREEIEPGVSPWSSQGIIGTDVEKETDQDLMRDLRQIGLGNSLNVGNESEPFEVWSYQLEGRPLLPRFKLNLQGVGLKLIFADRGGYGDYILVFRSEDFDF